MDRLVTRAKTAVEGSLLTPPAEEGILQILQLPEKSEGYQLLRNVIFRLGIQHKSENLSDDSIVNYLRYVPIGSDELGVSFTYNLGEMISYREGDSDVIDVQHLGGSGILYKEGGASLLQRYGYGQKSFLSWEEKRKDPDLSFITFDEFIKLQRLFQFKDMSRPDKAAHILRYMQGDQ